MAIGERGTGGAVPDGFDAFFGHATPIVFGYALRLCGGDRERAADITQDAWLAAVRQSPGLDGLPTVALLIAAARSRFIDQLRRERRLPAKLALVWSADRQRPPADDIGGELLAGLESLRPEHRAVLVLFYVDDLGADAAARELGLSRSATYALLARAKAELRALTEGASRG